MKKKAYFAAGCFWGVQKAFDETPGVLETTVGYMGGHKENPTYKEVCGGDTGHAEAIEVFYNPEEISYEKLLDKFFEIHDPTQLNRQGPDFGHQYRSAIFYTDEEQKAKAESAIEKLSAGEQYEDEIVTEVEPAEDFWKAEDYHQKYYIEHPGVC